MMLAFHSFDSRYFVQRGECEVFKRKREVGSKVYREQIVSRIHAGDYFGGTVLVCRHILTFFLEIALILDSKRTASVRARSFCTLCILERRHFQSIVSRYKEVKKVLERMILDRYKQQGVTQQPQMVRLSDSDREIPNDTSRRRMLGAKVLGAFGKRETKPPKEIDHMSKRMTMLEEYLIRSAAAESTQERCEAAKEYCTRLSSSNISKSEDLNKLMKTLDDKKKKAERDPDDDPLPEPRERLGSIKEEPDEDMAEDNDENLEDFIFSDAKKLMASSLMARRITRDDGPVPVSAGFFDEPRNN